MKFKFGRKYNINKIQTTRFSVSATSGVSATPGVSATSGISGQQGIPAQLGNMIPSAVTTPSRQPSEPAPSRYMKNFLPKFISIINPFKY